METLTIKDCLILLCVHPEKGWIRKRSQIGYALFSAALFDLVMRDCLRVEEGRIVAFMKETNDPLLDELMLMMHTGNGNKFSWVLNKSALKSGKYYNKQIKYLENKRLIMSRPLEWLGITWGKRYRVNRPGGLKPVLTAMDRVLIYGREPDMKLRLLIELLGALGIVGKFFPAGELSGRAKERYEKISKAPLSEHHESISAIKKWLRNSLRTSKGSSGSGF